MQSMELTDDVLVDDADVLADDARATHKTREEWLQAAVAALRPVFEVHAAPVAQAVRVACGWPSTATRSGTLGETWADTASRDKTIEILVSPVLDNPTEVLAVLIGQLCHATPGAMNHGNAFRDIAGKMGLEPLRKDWKSTRAGGNFDSLYGNLLGDLGIYPHAALQLNAGRQKQATRMLKAVCQCGYTIRLTEKWVKKGLPTCACGGKFVQA